MAATLGMKIADLMERHYPHEILAAVADVMRERAAERESKHSTDPAFNAMAADYRSVAMLVSTAANLADDLVR